MCANYAQIGLTWRKNALKRKVARGRNRSREGIFAEHVRKSGESSSKRRASCVIRESGGSAAVFIGEQKERTARC